MAYTEIINKLDGLQRIAEQRITLLDEMHCKGLYNDTEYYAKRHEMEVQLGTLDNIESFVIDEWLKA